MRLMKIFYYVKAFLIVRQIDKSLKKEGFKQVYHTYLSPPAPLDPLRDITEKELKFIEMVLGVVEKVCFLFFGKARCLHRSVASYHIFHKKGIPIDLVIGVKKKPFTSHAWLEFNGQVINDSEYFVNDLIHQFHTKEYRKM
ncbi:lasso peptide biosynthesis B2 protein [Bacillus spizizenii]|nr:lasso peptide biosynthesis B2 protein [Bacillus spizizenii]